MFGSITKIYQIIVPLLIHTAIVYRLGVAYGGMNTLFSSILQVLNLAELGVGSAMVYSMYQPIADGSREEICALMRLYRTYYRVIGLVIAAAGLALLPGIPLLVKSDVPAGISLRALYLLYLGTTVLSYWLFAYKNSLLIAHQRSDISSKVTLACNTVQYAVQLLVLFTIENYYVFLSVMLLNQIATNLLTAFMANRLYPQYRAAGTLSPEKKQDINRRIRDLFTAKVGGVIVNSADSIVISAFLGLNLLTMYQNYYYILRALINFFEIIFTACTAGIGNSLIVESREKNFNDLKKFSFAVLWLAGFCAACLLCLYQPFMQVWMGRELLLGFSMVVLFCLYFYCYILNRVLNIYKDAAGIWHQDRFRPLIAGIVNIVLNLLTVQQWQLYGVVLSTVAAFLLVEIPWVTYNLFHYIFTPEQMPGYVRRLVSGAAVTAAACALCCAVCRLAPAEGIAAIVVRGFICCIVPNLCFAAAWHRRPEFRALKGLLLQFAGHVAVHKA